MRADTLRTLTPADGWDVIDTDDGFRQANRIWKTMAFRFKAGPLVHRINSRVIENSADDHYDLIWIDKGVYLWPGTISHLRKRADCLVHFTPDTAFHANRSRHFFASAFQYDLLVTTKCFEIDRYHEIVDKNCVYLTTQAYDADLHQKHECPQKKKQAAVFIGLCEPDREDCIEALLVAGVPVRLGGRGWGRFVKRHSASSDLHYLGKDIFGDKYVSEYASARIGLGLLSKRFPELHTTRTFEIPACGALLATEKTADTVRFFGKDDVLFFDNYTELAEGLTELLKHPGRIEEVSRRGHQRVTADGYNYESVLSGILHRLSVIS